MTSVHLDRLISQHLAGDRAGQDLAFYQSPQLRLPAQRGSGAVSVGMAQATSMPNGDVFKPSP